MGCLDNAIKHFVHIITSLCGSEIKVANTKLLAQPFYLSLGHFVRKIGFITNQDPQQLVRVRVLVGAVLNPLLYMAQGGRAVNAIYQNDCMSLPVISGG